MIVEKDRMYLNFVMMRSGGPRQIFLRRCRRRACIRVRKSISFILYDRGWEADELVRTLNPEPHESGGMKRAVDVIPEKGGRLRESRRFLEDCSISQEEIIGIW